MKHLYGNTTLTEKEKKVTELVVMGYTNKAIACQFGTTENMIKNRLKVVYDKLGVYSRLELTLWRLKSER